MLLFLQYIFSNTVGSGMATRVGTGTISKLRRCATKSAWIRRERR